MSSHWVEPDSEGGQWRAAQGQRESVILEKKRLGRANEYDLRVWWGVEGIELQTRKNIMGRR